MTESMTCPQGWQSAQLLAYIEGDLDPAAERELLQHIETCPVCKQELHAIKRMDALLADHPESFHPEEEALFRFAIQGSDPEASISHHLDSCAECGKTVEAYRQMHDLKKVIPDTVPLPQALEDARLKGIPSADSEMTKTWSESFREIFSRLFTIPTLALGTAAAAILLAVFIIPLWQHLHENTIRTLAPLEGRPPGMGESAPTPEALPAAPKAASSQFHDESRPLMENAGPAGPPPEASSQSSSRMKLKREGKAAREAPPAQPAKPYGELHAQAPPRELPAIAEERKEKLDRSDARPFMKEREREPIDRLSRPPELLGETICIVRVVITDSEGRQIPLSQLQLSHESSGRENQPSLEADASGIPRYRVHIRLIERAQEFDIDAKLFDESPNEKNPLKSVMEYHVSKEELPKRIYTVVDTFIRYCKDLQK
jgi:anti-sigma factor RsiW